MLSTNYVYVRVEIMCLCAQSENCTRIFPCEILHAVIYVRTAHVSTDISPNISSGPPA